MKNLTWLLLVFSSICSAQTFDLAVKDVTVIDGITVASNQTVLIAGNKIHSVSEAAPYRAKRVIDGTGKFLIPGLWDMHVHIVYEDALIDAMPDLFLDYGVTSVRDTGALLDKIAPQVKRWRDLGDAAPELYFSGPLLDGRLVVYDGEGRPEIGVSNASVAQALENFEGLRASGVDFIKIYELVSPEVFRALVAAANRADLPIAAHVPLAMVANDAGPQVNSMEHLRNIEIACSDEAQALFVSRTAQIESPADKSGYELRRHLHATQRLKALATANPASSRCQKVIGSLKNTIQVPTLRLNTISQYSPLHRDDWSQSLEQLPADLALAWQASAARFANMSNPLGEKMSQWSMDLVAEMVAQGTPIGAGTDTPIASSIPGYSLHTELERLVDAGMKPQQALASATLRPAEFFQKQTEMGQIRAGMEADLVLLSKNPLEDIRNTRTIINVIANGVVIR